MAQEIEAKFHLEDDWRVREALKAHGGRYQGKVLETNRYFDWPDESLRRGDRGLRIRVAQPLDTPGGESKITITYKGPRQQSQVKVREEIEFRADDADAVAAILQGLGLTPSLSFQKRRESWHLAKCHIEFDELPLLGRFLEIEGPDESCIKDVREKLGLGEVRVQQTPYIGLLYDYCRAHGITTRQITF